MVEVKDQSHSLIEKFLRLRIAGGNWMMQVPKPRHQGGFFRSGLTRHGELLGGEWTAKRKRYQDAYRELHGGFSSICVAGLGYQKFYTLRNGELIRTYLCQLLLLAEYLTQQGRSLCRRVLANLPLFFTHDVKKPIHGFTDYVLIDAEILVLRHACHHGVLHELVVLPDYADVFHGAVHDRGKSRYQLVQAAGFEVLRGRSISAVKDVAGICDCHPGDGINKNLPGGRRRLLRGAIHADFKGIHLLA